LKCAVRMPDYARCATPDKADGLGNGIIQRTSHH
jgi:hypothetical protein